MQLIRTRLSSVNNALLVVVCLLILVIPFANCNGQNNTTMELTLSQAIDLALKQNRNLNLARLSVVESESKKEIAQSSYFPHVRNESSLLHLTELAGVDIPAGAFGHGAVTGLIPPQDITIGQGSLTTYTSGTGLLQPLTQMFKIREANRAATADVNASKIKLEQAENDIALRVRQLYYGLLITQLKQEAAEHEVAAAELKGNESTDAVEQGRSLEVVALESRAALLDAKQSALTLELQRHNLLLSLNDLLGLPLRTQLQLDKNTSSASVTIPTREEAIRLAEEQSPEVRTAQQAVLKAKAGLAAAKDEYIPDVTGIARYSYQSGVPFLVHNFGTFGFTLTYTLFDGGRRSAEIKGARALRSQAEINLAKVREEIAVQVESAYDKVEQLQHMVRVADEALKVRVEASRLSDSQFEQDATVASARAAAHAKASAARAAHLEASLGLVLAQADLKRLVGLTPR